MSSAGIHAPSLEASENKSRHIKFTCQRMLLHVSSTSAVALCLISTLMQSVSLKNQNMKVVEVFLRLHIIYNHLNRSSDERVMPRLRNCVKTVQNHLINFVLPLMSPFTF
jgi:5,10-methenyltetrahydromethanopterin hydrogenase